jgi:hypothetical protein
MDTGRAFPIETWLLAGTLFILSFWAVLALLPH